MNKTVGRMYQDWLQDKNSSSFEVYCYDQGIAEERERIVRELEKLKEDSANYSDDDIFLGEYRAYKLAIEIVKGE